MLKPLTIEDLQESAEDYKRLHHDRMKKFTADTEAIELEFLSREFDLWDFCLHYLNLEKYKDSDWYEQDDDNVQVLYKGMNQIGYEKVLFSVRRKIEFINEQIFNIKRPVDFIKEQLPVSKNTQPTIKVETPSESIGINKTESEKDPELFDIIHVAIACYCLEIYVTSPKGKALVEKYTNRKLGGLYKDKYQIAESYFKIEKNKKVDNAKDRAITAAKRLILKLKNKNALATITELQSRFEKEYISYYK